MIHTSRQLKALVRNMSMGNSNKAQTIIRVYIMERFLERLSISQYRDNLILKGGLLVSAIVGLVNRSTMDMDTTIKGLTLSVESAQMIVQEIASVPLEDGIVFEIRSAALIMDEADYPGVRVILETSLESMNTPLKIDFSTGDVITPREICYSFPLLFENRTIPILAYNLETVLAEKMETLLARGTANTRMRDFYDIYVLETTQLHDIDPAVFGCAYANTSRKRGSFAVNNDAAQILDEVTTSSDMKALWADYRSRFDYANNIAWDDVIKSVRKLFNIITWQKQ